MKSFFYPKIPTLITWILVCFLIKNLTWTIGIIFAAANISGYCQAKIEEYLEN